MSRAEKRREDRSNNKLAKWLMGLSREQKHLLTEYCIEQSKQDLVGYFNAYERVLRPTLYEITNDEIEAEDILQKIIYRVGVEGTNLHQFENGSVEYMNKLEESRADIISKYNEMKNAGIPEKDIQNSLKTLFIKFTASAIKNIVTEYKRDLKKEQIKGGDTDDAMAYIFEEEQTVASNKINAEKAIIVEEISEFKATTKLKIKSLVIEGEFGTYEKSIEGVKRGELIYKDIAEVKNSKKAIEVNITAKKENIMQQIEALNEKLIDIEEGYSQKFQELEEIEQVFSM